MVEKFNFVEKRASLQLADGSYKFDKMISAPDFWSERAVTIAADKYLFGDKESSIAELVLRVASHISQMNRDNIGDYYDDEFYWDITRMLLNQRAAFNSPVWFNVGVGPKLGVKGSAHNFYWDRETGEILPCHDTYQYPQGAACFIQSVDDTMESIMRLAASEAMLFKYGSGTGTDLSTIRSSRERLSNGGTPSGPLSFMRIYDQIAMVVKSGGKCLTGNQCVYTPDRGPITVRELAERDMQFLVLSYDPPSGITKVKSASCWQSGTKNCVRVTTDKGVFEASADHPFILAGTRDACMAADLKPGMRMFGGRASERFGYLKFHETGGRRNRELIHRMVARDIMGDNISGMAVHHIDGNSVNNSPANLDVMSKEEHAALHGRERAMAGEHVFVTRSWPHRGSDNGMHKDSPFYKNKAKVESYKKKQGDILRKSGRAREMQVEAARSKMANHAWKLINMGFAIETMDEYIRLRQEHLGRIPSIKNISQQIIRNFGSYENMLEYMSDNNHTIVSVEDIGAHPVFSVEVNCDTEDDKSPDSGHNFLIWSLDNESRVGTGLFVHNTRRAAKMQSLKVSHPDIAEFIECKWREELKAKALVAAGYSSGLDGEAILSAFFQNSNTSVRVSDEFMRAVEMHETYDTIAVTTGEPVDKLNASKVLMRIAEATWKCGDPGLQFDDTINYWHTCKNSGRINASNPCCFTGDTLVKTSEGDMTFDELMSTCDLPYAFAWDFKTNMPVLRKIKKVWRSGDSERLVRVTTDRGITVECTPEHKFYLRDGSAVEAQDLKNGMRLRKMPISQNVHRGGRRVIRHKSIPGNKRGEQWLSRFIWTQVNGEISDGVEIHHRNHDRTDDRLSNLGTIHDSDHRSYHGSGLNNGRAFRVDDFVMVEAYDEVASTENATHKGKEGSVNASRWNRYVRDNGLVGVLPIANSRGIQGKSWDEFHAWIEDRKCLVNDRVKSVQHIEMCVPVYDMEVEDVHNFTVTSPGNLHGIVVSNSEYMFLDDSACNLASLNLIKYIDDRDNFQVLKFAKDIRTLIRAMDALVDGCSYPTAQIAENSHKFRPLGLGYCNLGGLLMALGVPYDSDAGRAIASEITSYMTAIAYHESAMIAIEAGAFDGFARNREPMLEVVSAHWKYSKDLASAGRLIDGMTIDDAWSNAYADGRTHGYRNAQVTVLAPTGTISLLMDAETGGIEPFLGLIAYKKLVGGGTLTKASQLVERGLKRLGYDGEHLDKILEYIKNHNNVLTDLVKREHQNVFETSFGAQALPWKAHIDMMAAVQPFLSGAISKCVTGDTVITTDRGLVRIGDLYRGEAEDSFSTIDLAVDSGKRTMQASEFYFGGIRDVFEVTTSDGRKIRGTAPHRLMVATNEGLTWKRITEIEDGDYIAIKLGSEMWGNKTDVELSSIPPLYGSQKAIQLPSEIDEDLALLLGMITADGSIVRNTYTVSICKNEVSVLDTFDRIMLDKFGLVSRRTPASVDRGAASLVSSKSLCEWFDAIGFSKDYIPDVIMQGPRRHAIAYLSGLYLDGWIRQSVSICQKRRTLLDDVQRIWDNLGVHTYFTDNFVNGLNYPVLHVHSHHRKYAADLIYWLEAHKQKRACELENGQDRRVFPMYREYIKNAIRDNGATQEFRNVMDGRTQNITMPTARSAVGKLGIKINPEVFDYEYVLAVSVNHVGQEAVYDLSIPEDHSFVANGIVNHNTVNMPNDATVDDIYNAYHYAWRSGLKSIAIYRDGSKATQPESSEKDDHIPDATKMIEPDHIPDVGKMVDPQPMTAEMLEKMAMDFDSIDLQVFDTLRELVSAGGRTRLPETRNSITHKFDIAGHEGYLTVGLYKNGQPGELFITISKEGSTIAGLLGVVGTLFSMAVQFGVPLSRICDKFIYSKFEPSGWTNNPEIGYAHSIVDYIFRWLKMRFIDAPIETEDEPMPNKDTVKIVIKNSEVATGEPCKNCGGSTVPSGACWVCTQCGETTGCG